MNSKSSKRRENKKKKMAALLEITKLNEFDRLAKKAQMSKTKDTNDFSNSELEPSPKRPRTELHITNDSCFEPPLLITLLEQNPSPGVVQWEEEYLTMKKMLREKAATKRKNPKFYLRDVGANASLGIGPENRTPLFLSDIQHLILYSQLGHYSAFSPSRWCALEKHPHLASTTVLVAENLSCHHFSTHEASFPFITSTFENKLEVLAQNSEPGDIIKHLSMISLTPSQMRRYIDEFGNMESAIVKSSENFDSVRDLFVIASEDETAPISSLPTSDRFPRTQLVLSGWQMVEENFPLPVKGLMETKFAGYVATKERYGRVTSVSPMFGLDCEMCKTTSGDLELTRVSVVDESLNVFYDTLVKPANKITDYLTRYSGITHKMMKPVTTKLRDVQKDLRRLLPSNAILVGHSLSNDLHALKMMHPYAIDTSVIFNLTGERHRKTKLKTLVHEFLSERIQDGKSGHCSTEDSSASLKLTQLKLTKTLSFGDAVLGSVRGIPRPFPDLENCNYTTSLFKQTTKIDKSAFVVGLDDIGAKYKSYVDRGADLNAGSTKINCVSEKSCKELITKLCDSMKQYSLNVGHVKINDAQLESTKVLRKVDKWVKKIHESAPSPGLLVVLFTGTAAHNGACFIQIKKEII